MLKTKFPITQLCTLAFLSLMTISSLASNGYTTNQTVGSEPTFVDNRSSVTLWLLDIGDDYSCISGQRYFDRTMTFEGSLTQTMTACTDGQIKKLHINGAVTGPGNSSNALKVKLIDPQGNIVGESSTIWQQSMDHLEFNFTSTEVHAGGQYTIELTASEGMTIVFNTVTQEQYFTGQLLVNGVHELKNLCFMGLIYEAPVELDDGTHDHGDVDHNLYDEWDPWAHDFYVKPPSEVEELKHSVYPNPFVVDFRVEIQTEAEMPGIVTLYNFMGKKVFEQKLENISESKFIQINPQTVLNKGYYTLRIEYGAEIILDTVVKN